MKHWLTLVTWFLVVPIVHGRENSILYPKQLQPKRTARQACQTDGEWKRYGSVKECAQEKHHEEIVAHQQEILHQQEEFAAQSQDQNRKLRDEERARYEAQLLRESVKSATGNSR